MTAGSRGSRVGGEFVVGVGATEKSTQFAAKDASGRQVNVEVARVVRQPHLLDERAYVGVDEIAAPGRVGRVVLDVWIALGEAE